MKLKDFSVQYTTDNVVERGCKNQISLWIEQANQESDAGYDLVLTFGGGDEDTRTEILLTKQTWKELLTVGNILLKDE